MPILVIVAIFAATAVMGFSADSGVDKKRVKQEVAALLAEVPQKGATLGSPRAPITLWMFADLECPTVKRFVEAYLPSIITTWVRSDVLKIEYRSMQTDTQDESIFFRQEIAALAAGRQNKMWNFALTFIHEQGKHYTPYASVEFLDDIASQVPGLSRTRWRLDQREPVLTKQVALAMHSAQFENLRYTPSFRLGFTSGEVNRGVGLSDRTVLLETIQSSLENDLQHLRTETATDVPTLKASDSTN